MAKAQLDLFGRPQGELEELLPQGFDAQRAELAPRVRDELRSTLATVQAAERLPWPDLTRTTLAELRFHSIARWLPAEEAADMRAAFEIEMTRLYAAEDAAT